MSVGGSVLDDELVGTEGRVGEEVGEVVEVGAEAEAGVVEG